MIDVEPWQLFPLPPEQIGKIRSYIEVRERAAFERGKAEGIAEERRERVMAALARDVPTGVKCRINGGPWAPLELLAGQRGDVGGLFARAPEWSGTAGLAALDSAQRLGPVKVEVSLWGVLLVGDAHLAEISYGWPGGDGARLVGRTPLRHPDVTGGSDAA